MPTSLRYLASRPVQFWLNGCGTDLDEGQAYGYTSAG
jgi:hypothetical protein